MRNKVIVTFLEVLFELLPERPEKNHEQTQDRWPPYRESNTGPAEYRTNGNGSTTNFGYTDDNSVYVKSEIISVLSTEPRWH